MMNKILTAEQTQARLIEIASAERVIYNKSSEWIPMLEEQVIELKDELKDVKERLAYVKKGQAAEMREQLQADFDAHLQAGGAVDVHPRIKIRRNSKWMYDQKKALVWAQENGIRDVIRVKESLVKLAFDKLIDEGHYQDVEQVKSVSIILPSVMGDLLIESQEKE